MGIRSAFITLVGVAVAGGSVFLARDLLDADATLGQAEASRMDMVDVIVARVELPFGSVIERQMLTTQKWPAEFAPPNMFTSFDGLVGTDPNQPRRASRPISPGEPILASKVSNFGERVTIAQTLGPNRRAMAISVDAVTSVGGFVTPGDRVDVVLTQRQGDGFQAVTILQNVRVIGTDQDSDENRDAARVARTVTVDVSPEDSQKLALAQQAGRLSLTLRTLDDTEFRTIEMMTLRDLQLYPEPEVVGDEPVMRQSREVTVRRGNLDVQVIQLR